jgi:hypothetical protein
MWKSPLFNYRFSKTVLYIINIKLHGCLFGNTGLISRVEYDISLVCCSQSWDIIFNTRACSFQFAILFYPPKRSLFSGVLWDATKDLLNYTKTNMNCSLQILPRKSGRCENKINILGLLSEVVRPNFYFLSD